MIEFGSKGIADALSILKQAYARHGYRYSEEGPEDCNFFGIRAGNSGTFDDVIGVGRLRDIFITLGTTDPGIPFLRTPMTAAGTGRIVPGQYRGVWSYDSYKNRPALKQVGVFTVVRDNDRDDEFEVFPGSPQLSGNYGAHLHYMGDGPKGQARQIGKWSAMCQGAAFAADHAVLMQIAARQKQWKPNWNFTYTLFDLAQDPALAPLVEIAKLRATGQTWP